MLNNKDLLKKAFQVLRRNYGCPGNDGVSIKDIKKNYEHYESIVWKSLKTNSYNFEKHPKRTAITDYSGNKRTIFVYNVIERWFQQCIKLQIEPVIDAVLPEYVYGYRRKKSDTDSYNYILKNNPRFILRVDTRNYFESINREKLLVLLKELGVSGDLLRVMSKSFGHYKEGLPSGHVLSCVLSNLYLSNFDSNFTKNYTRYSDDMMFALGSIVEVIKTIFLIKKLLKTQGLYLNYKKTKIIYKPTLKKIS